MSSKPDVADLLYKNLFEASEDETFKRISSGVQEIPNNAQALLEESQILIKEKRTSRADFLVTTAQEEIAKTYMLLDACRIDFSRHETVLRKICRAFYSHLAKHGYYEIIKHHDSRLLDYIEKVRHLFTFALKDWWLATSDIEYGEPDLPGDVFFKREINLYADFSDYDQVWISPQTDGQRMKYGDNGFGNTPISEGLKLLDRIVKTRDAGLFEPEILKILNDKFKSHYINEKITNKELLNIYDKVYKEIDALKGLESSGTFPKLIGEVF